MVKQVVNKFGTCVKRNIINQFKEMFKANQMEIRNSANSKMKLHSVLKNEYGYEKYLDLASECNVAHLTKFRLSAHKLPIERGRYSRPKIPREKRWCLFCRKTVGNEFHVTMICKNKTLLSMREKYLTRIQALSPQINALPQTCQFLYIVSGNDMSLNPIICQWLGDIDKAHKELSP